MIPKLFFYKLSISFSCPSCRANNTIQAATMLNKRNRDEAAQRSAQLPLKCAKCNREAPRGTNMRSDVAEISQIEFEALKMGNSFDTRI